MFEKQYLDGELEVEFNPQGTLAERIRAGGAGIPAFYTKTGYGTLIAEGKETRAFGDENYLMETGLVCDLALVKAWKGDTAGNLVFRKTARNFNAMMATAGRTTVAEVEHLVEPGELDPDGIHTAGIFIHRMVEGATYENRIEQRTTRPRRGRRGGARGSERRAGRRRGWTDEASRTATSWTPRLRRGPCV